MNKVIAFKIEIEGQEVAIRNEKELADAVKQVNNAYKTSDFGSDKRKELAKSLGTLKKLQADNRQEVKDLGRENEIAADKGARSYRALNAELVNTRRAYKELSEEARNGVGGQQALKQIQALDKELKEIDATIGQNQRNVGNYASAFADLGGFDLAALATPAGLITAAGTAAIAAAGYVKELSDEYRALRSAIELQTGAAGDQLNEFTNRTLAIAETFNKTTDEVSNAANALSKRIGISFESALDRVQNGLVAGLDKNGQFIDSLEEYPQFFADAFGPGEVAANRFFEVIRLGNEQGIFNDKAVDAVKEVTLRLGELPQAAQDALEGIGLSSDEIRKQIEEEGIGAAISTVSTRLGELDADSQEVRTAVADIFGGAGEDAGLDFLISLQNIDKASSDLIGTTNDYQKAQLETLKVNEDFAAAQQELADAFGGTGETVDNLFTKGQTLLLQFLVPIIDGFRVLLTALDPIREGWLKMAREIGLVSEEGGVLTAVANGIGFALKALSVPISLIASGYNTVATAIAGVISKGKEFLSFIGLISDEQEEAGTAAANMGRANRGAFEELRKQEQQQKNTAKATEENRKKVDALTESTKKAAVVTDKFAKGSLAELQDRLSGLKKELDGVSPGNEASLLADIVGTEEAIEEIKTARERIRAEVSRIGDNFERIELIETEQIGAVESITAVAQEAADRQAQIDEDLQRRIIENNKQTAERTKQNNIEAALEEAEQRKAIIAELTSTIFSSFNNINSQLAEGSQGRTDNEIADVEERYEAEIEAAEGNEERQEELRQQQAEAVRELQEKELEDQKRFRIAAALASLAEGTINILSSPSVIPDPFGTIYKGVQIGILGATTALQIGNIRRQRVAAKGTIVNGEARGESHNGPNRGISMMLNGQPVLVENGERITGDEFGGIAVVNKRSSSIFRGPLDAISDKVFQGKRAMLSAINSYRGLGTSFMERGGVVAPSLSAISAIQDSQPGARVSEITIGEEAIAEIAQAVFAGTMAGSAEGTVKGSGIAAKEQSRQIKLNSRTKV